MEQLAAPKAKRVHRKDVKVLTMDLKRADAPLTDCVRGLSAETAAKVKDRQVKVGFTRHEGDMKQWQLWICLTSLDDVCRAFCDAVNNCGVTPGENTDLQCETPVFQDKYNRWIWRGPFGYSSRQVTPLMPGETLEDYRGRKEAARLSLLALGPPSNRQAVADTEEPSH